MINLHEIVTILLCFCGVSLVGYCISYFLASKEERLDIDDFDPWNFK